MAQKYQELSDKIVGLVGGKANVQFFTHCVTRLRFNVKDESAVKKDEIEKLPGVLGSQWQNGQYQIIIGQAVNDAYRLICEKNGFAVEKSVDEKLDDRKARPEEGCQGCHRQNLRRHLRLADPAYPRSDWLRHDQGHPDPDGHGRRARRQRHIPAAHLCR